MVTYMPTDRMPIQEIAAMAVRIATEAEERCEFTVDGVRLIARPRSDPMDLVIEFKAEMTRRKRGCTSEQ